MADYRKLAMDLILADDQVDENEAKLLKRALFSEGKIEPDDVEFLIQLRTTALRKNKTLAPIFEKLFLDVVQSNVMTNGTLNPDGVDRLKKLLVNDKKIDNAEKKKFLDRIKKVTVGNADFDKLYDSFSKKLAAPAAGGGSGGK